MHVNALGCQEGVAHAAADDDLVGFLGERLDDAELVGHLGAAEHHHVGAFGGFGYLFEHVDFFLHEATGIVREALGHIVHGGLGAVDHAEPVGHEGAVVGGEGDQLVGEGTAFGFVFGGFAGVEAHVFQQEHVAVGQAVGALVGVFAHDVTGEGHVLAEGVGEGCGDGCEGEFGVDLPFGAAQVGHEDDFSAGLREGFNGGQGCGDPAGIGDFPRLVQGNVEVGTDENVAACHSFGDEILQRFDCHRVMYLSV